MKISYLGWQCSLQEPKAICQIPQHQARKDFFWVVVRIVQETPETLQAIAVTS